MRAIKRLLLTLPLLILTACIQPASAQDAQVVCWPAPEGSRMCTDTSVRANGEDIPVYETAVNNNRAYTEYPTLDSAPVALFDFSGEVTVRIERAGTQSAVVRPLSAGITPDVKDGVVSFTLTQPGYLTIEFDGDTRRALHLFTERPETDVPSPDDENVIYFGPGIHTRPIVRLRSGQSVYLAGGAVLRGKIVSDKASNIRVYGRGIIDGSTLDRFTQRTVPIEFNLCKNVTIEGVTFLDPAGWTVNTFACSEVSIHNIKIISARPNGDGLTAQSCSNYIAEHCFVRSWDDSLVVKNYGQGISHDIVFRDILIWTDLAQSCEIGYETRGSEIYNVTFERITVLHNFHKPVLSIHNSDQAHVHDILYRDIIVEDARMGGGDAARDNFLIDLTIADSVFAQSDERGRISNITFERITVLDGFAPPSRLMGYDAQHAIEGVTIRGLTLLGQAIDTPEAGGFRVYNHVRDFFIE